jgi:hypothetical protein
MKENITIPSDCNSNMLSCYTHFLACFHLAVKGGKYILFCPNKMVKSLKKKAIPVTGCRGP